MAFVIEPVEAIKWIAIIFIVGFIGYFGKYLSKIIIAKVHKKRPEAKSETSVKPAKTKEEMEYELEKKRLKLEKKHIKAVKKAKK